MQSLGSTAIAATRIAYLAEHAPTNTTKYLATDTTVYSTTNTTKHSATNAPKCPPANATKHFATSNTHFAERGW
jgi:hypothetical protein